MREQSADLWELHSGGAIVAITTGGMVSKSGNAVLLRGCARQAREQFPELPQILGAMIQQHGSRVFDLGERLISFPVEEDPFCRPELSLIDRSSRELLELVDSRGWKEVVVPRPGCGSGGLSWGDVRPILQKYFDDRFLVITAREKDDVCHATQSCNR